MLGRRLSLRCSHGPVRAVGSELGSIRDVKSGLSSVGGPVAIRDVRRGLGSITNIHVVYKLPSSVCALTSTFLDRSSVILVRGGSCVTGPGPGKCHDLRLVIRVPVFLRSRGGVVGIRIRLEAVSVS